MILLNTIEQATVYYDTACKPLLVHCDDRAHYVAKYATAGDTSADKLLREFLGAAYLRIWELHVQPYAFIRLKSDHIGVGGTFRRRPAHSVPMFGSLHSEALKEVDNFLSQMPVGHRLRYKQNDFLMICFADIWLANEDRNWNNYNLLVSANDSTRGFVPIDHEAIFNSGSLKQGLYTLDGTSSLLSTPLLHRLHTINELTDEASLLGLFARSYLYIQRCKNATPGLLGEIPREWQINVQQLQTQLSAQLFTDSWFNDCKMAFLEILQQALNNRKHGN